MQTFEKNRDLKNKAFTLLELSIVLVIISVVMGGAMVIFNQSMEQQQTKETQVKMAAIQKALLDYRRAFLRIPCPADATQNMDATSSNYYGVEAANNGTCISATPAANFSIGAVSFTGTTSISSAVVTGVSSTTGLSIGTLVSGTGIPAGTSIASIDSATQITLDTAATAANIGVTISYNTIAGGMIPTKTLQLPDDYAIDGWGHRIMYMVDVNLTSAAGFANVPVTDTATNRITVKDAAAANKTTGAVYLLASYGKNGHGAYPRSGGTARLVYSGAATDEVTNSYYNTTGSASTFAGTFVQKPANIDAFDDLVVYAARSDM